jgi:hypothetical protein
MGILQDQRRWFALTMRRQSRRPGGSSTVTTSSFAVGSVLSSGLFAGRDRSRRDRISARGARSKCSAEKISLALSASGPSLALDSWQKFENIRWYQGRVGVMSFANSKYESLLALHESVRRQVEADNQSGDRYRLAGDGVRQYAEKLRELMDRRRLRFNCVDWA